MQCNVGGLDMYARLLIGLVLLVVGVVAPLTTVWKVVVFVVAGIALLTGFFRYCPVNTLLGLNTCKKES